MKPLTRIFLGVYFFAGITSLIFSWITKSPNGIASWYSRNSPGIKMYTASGERFDDSKKTCATWDYPLGAHLKVTSLETEKSVECRVNDRGPAKRLGRKIDLSRAAFKEIKDLKGGLTVVSVKEV